MKKALKLLDDLESEYREISVSEDFYNSTKIKKTIKPIPISKWPKEWIEVNYKTYPRLKKIPIKISSKKLSKNYLDLLKSRESFRDFKKKKISFESLSNLLYYSSGIINIHKDSNRRFYPSAGGRYPLEIYVVSFKGNELEQGIYHYNVKDNLLEILKSGDYKSKFLNNINQDWVKKAGMLIVVTAVFGRNQIKYGDRGFRYILIEAGHMGQNIDLIANAYNFGTCIIGAYNEDGFNDLLDLDGINESVIDLIALGVEKGR